MEAPATPDILQEQLNEKQPIDSKEYVMNIDQETYLLKIIIYSNQTINFNVKQTNILTFNYYEKTHDYEAILDKLILIKNQYKNMDKILKFIDKAISKKDIRLQKDQTEDKKNQLIIIAKRPVDYEVIEAKIELNEKKIKTEEMIKLLTNDINNIKKFKDINNKGQDKDKDNYEDQKENQKKTNDKIKQIEDTLKNQEVLIQNQKKETIKLIEEKIRQEEENR